ncbi:MAG: DinB family protein [Luteitalea sp.]|nr:DinB family protein [Luteitalea sp.]
MSADVPFREQIARLLDWEDAHVSFDTAVAGIPPDFRGRQPPGLPYSPWQLLEHIRRTQHDILEFCRNSRYQELEWPADYWPPLPAPASAAEWDACISRFADDREALRRLALDPKTDLTAPIPHGTGQTYLRELVLAADHTTYHVGELVVVRRLLGIWKSA